METQGLIFNEGLVSENCRVLNARGHAITADTRLLAGSVPNRAVKRCESIAEARVTCQQGFFFALSIRPELMKSMQTGDLEQASIQSEAQPGSRNIFFCPGKFRVILTPCSPSL
jgi:hypothetical protein